MRKHGATTSSAGGSAAEQQLPASIVTGASNKKKFGKNLNRLVKPAAPPIVDRSLGSSRNGLLLLSKNKSSNGAAAAGSGGGGSNSTSALSSTLSAPPASGGLLSKSLASANTASSAASTSTVTLQGSVAAITATTNSTHALLLSAVKGETLSGATAVPSAWKGASAPAPTAPAATAVAPTVSVKTDAPLLTQNDTARELQESDATRVPNTKANSQGPAWDEYGGRDSVNGYHRDHPVATPRTLVDVDDSHNNSNYEDESQAVVMSRFERERAEQKRQEEQKRLLEQQQKASQRLRELDDKKKRQQGLSSSDAMTATNATRRGWDLTRSGSKELWEPGQEAAVTERRGRSNSSGNRQDSPGGVMQSSTRGGGGEIPQSPPHASGGAAAYNGPVIHLSSYEDRDRGEARTSASAPRMLFDPKSGAMVAVKSRDESAAETAVGSSSGATKKRTKKNNGRSKEGGGGAGATTTRESPSTDGTKVTRRPKKESRGDSPSGATGEESSKVVSSGNTGVLQKPVSRRTLPRTCGVLYRRDDQGHCYCADDCDGDLGYGSHSVRGGRTKNPQAYADFVQQHLLQYNKNSNAVAGRRRGFDGYDDAGQYDGGSGGGGVALHTGFTPDEDMLLPEPIEYVRADDKLELVTGLDDSPSLKPTAKEWAPSQAALAAARAVAERTSHSIAEDSSDDDDDAENFELDGGVALMADDDDDDVDDDMAGPLGLGFDPTLDMDFVMNSPSNEDEAKRVESLAISALDLEPPAFSQPVSSGATSGPRHIFAFGTSGTWGVSHPVSTLTGGDWKVSEIGDVAGLFGGGAFRIDDTNKATAADATATSTTTILNAPTSISWGSLPTSALGGLTSGTTATGTPNHGVEALLPTTTTASTTTTTALGD